ncbi:MAG TPA: hypothetical protein VFC00_09680 [Micromonosporaceae bacterium]|nr:hypothetical protein [Micromonosporaceae bacterium]
MKPIVFDGRRLLQILAVLVVSVAGLAWLLSSCTADDSDLTVPAPAASDRQAVVAQLAQATAAHGVCYGWHLSNGGTTVSQGSNLGDAAPVTTCDRWMQLVVTVYYTPESSEAEDSVSIEVDSSNDLYDERPTPADLARLGLTDGRFLDEPDDTIMRGTLALPLLLAERGAVGTVPTPTGIAAPAGPPLPASSDFWRDRLGLVVAAIVLIVVAALLGLYGWLTLRAASKEQKT